MKVTILTALILIGALVPGCYDGLDVDLSGLSREEKTDFGSSEAVSRYAYALVELGRPDRVNDRYPQGRYGLWQQVPGDDGNEWEWRNRKYKFEPVIKIECEPMSPRCPPGDLAIKYLQVCNIGEGEICVEFEIDGLQMDRRSRRTAYRIDLLVQKDDRWYFLWGGCPIMNWAGHRALWGVGWIDREEIKHLVGKKEEFSVLLVVRDLLTGKQEKGVTKWKEGGEKLL